MDIFSCCSYNQNKYSVLFFYLFRTDKRRAFKPPVFLKQDECVGLRLNFDKKLDFDNLVCDLRKISLFIMNDEGCAVTLRINMDTLSLSWRQRVCTHASFVVKPKKP